ncbi:TonB-dependent receptor plug domain-containing protein [Kangiella taiwanensis]|uniref:TonB-dependent receptor n=1 Tax=Kangiella taiwanensis TaxID=1079179 RepID=A0ABP8I7U1_9GAMM|nr:TonB-dependent receptor [Kangiella taiwanensis]
MSKHNIIAKAVKLALFASASLAFTTTAYAAEEGSEEEQEEQVQETETVTVVGSRLKRNHAEGASPVLIITGDDMKKQGHTTVYDALNDLTINTGVQIEGPEFSGGFTPDIRTLNIRGFGVGNSLTLINGRRVANYPAAYQGSSSAVNFGAIPQAAIERIEVLSGGGSSIYGSDAVAGVVNIVLKQNVDETTLNVIYGRPVEAEGNDYRVDLTTGTVTENGNFSVGISYRKTDPISAGDYDKYDSNDDYPYSDIEAPTLNFDTYVLDRNSFTLVDPGNQCENFGSERFLFSESLGYLCGRDNIALTNFRNEREQLSVFANGTYDLGDVELFGELLYNSSESSVDRYSIFIQERIFNVNNGDYYTVLRSFYESDLQRSLDSQFEDNSYNASFGARGYFGDHEWEASVYRSEYELESSRVRFKAQEAIDVFFGDFLGYAGATPVFQGNGTFGLFDNLFAQVDDSNRDLVNSALGTQTYGNETSSTGAQFMLRGDLWEMSAGPVSYAGILEFEKQELKFVPDELITQQPPFPYTAGSGWLGLTGYDGEGDRTRTALGMEMNIPLHETLDVNIAARADKYDSDSSSIGTRVTPSVKFEWRPSDSFLFRGGYSESFRAPDLVQVYSRTGFYTTVTDLYSCWQGLGEPGSFDAVEDCTGTQIFARRLGPGEVGNEPLKDETGDTRWAGFVYDITDDLSFQLDWQKVTLEDRVAQLSSSSLLFREFDCLTNGSVQVTGSRPSQDLSDISCDQVSNLITRVYNPDDDVDEISGFNVTPRNISEESVESLDARLIYGFDIDYGRLDFVVNYSHLLSHEFDGVELRDDPILGGWEPRSNVNATAAYSYDDFSVALTMLRRGSTTVYDPGHPLVLDGTLNDRVPPHFRYNLTTSYNWSSDFRTRLTIRDLFDNGAPRDQTIGPNAFPWYNNFVYGGAGIGREVYLEATYVF